MTAAAEMAEGGVRQPPHNLPAEQCVLGGMLLSRDAIADVLEVLRSGDFYRPGHQIVYEAILSLYGRGEPADAITVAAELVKCGEIGRMGGAPYLHTLIASVPSAASAGYYARIVMERAVLRRLAEVGTRIAQMGYAGGDDATMLLERAESELYAITDRRTGNDYQLMSALVPEALSELDAMRDRGGGLTGVPTGFADLDGLTSGLHAGQMVTIAARPALGKSTLALDIARNAAVKHNLPSVFFSLEMSRTEVTFRCLAAESRVPLANLRTGQMSDDDWARLDKHTSDVISAPLFVDDSPDLSMMSIRAKCRRLKQRHDLRLVIIDYLQLLSSAARRPESRQVEVSDISRSLKLLAKELDVPVIAVAQLNRGPEQRADHRPMLADLRESGSIEQDSDVVILLHREDAYDRDTPRAGEADFIIAKHRNGPTATVTVAFQGHYSRFVDMAPI